MGFILLFLKRGAQQTTTVGCSAVSCFPEVRSLQVGSASPDNWDIGAVRRLGNFLGCDFGLWL